MDEVKKKRALTILVSWLEATRTPHQVKNGDPTVDVLIGDTPYLITENDLGLVAPIDKALPIFWGITERAGVGKPKPQFRPQFVGSLLPHEDNDLVAMRHTEFRRVPNNPEVFLREDYKKIVSWAVSRFYRFNRQQLKQLGYEPEDLKTYAWLYVMNFHGLWRNVHATDKQNGANLCSYLHQRLFRDFRKLIDRKCQNVLIDAETASLAMNFDIVPQWDRDDNSNGRRNHVAVSIERPDDLGVEFDALPIKVQMNKLTSFMKTTRRGDDVKREAEERLLGLPGLSLSARKQIYKFHVESLPDMSETEKKEHSKACVKCRLVSEATSTSL